MTHEQALERLDDYACGELPDIERVMVQRHVDGCGECQAEVGAIQALLAEAAVLPRTIAPPRDLWAGIAPRLAPRTVETPAIGDDPKVIPLAPRRRHWQPPRWAMQIAAAVVLMAGSSGITAILMRQQGPAAGPVALDPTVVTAPRSGQTLSPTGGTRTGGSRTVADPSPGSAAVPTAFAAFRPAERDYEAAISDLTRVLDTRRGRMAPETVETLERNLRIIDAAIAESRDALERDPNSRELLGMLSATYDAKVKMLRQAVAL